MLARAMPLVGAGAVAIDEPEPPLDIPAVEGSAAPVDTQLAFRLEPPARPPG